MTKLTLLLSDDEMKAVAKFAPMLGAIKHVVPSDLLSVLQKIEMELERMRNGGSEPSTK